MGEQTAPGFGGLLRRLRAAAGLTQEELAEAARLSPRSVSDLERGINRTARKETARLLADALGLIGPARAEFEAAAKGRPVAGGAGTGGVAAATRTLPRDVASFTGRQAELGQLAKAAAGCGGVAGIYAIGGMAGVGKTAFAVHAAHQLAGLGRCALAAGHTDEAAEMLRQALEIFQRIGAAEAAGVSAELDAATEAQSAAPGS